MRSITKATCQSSTASMLGPTHSTRDSCACNNLGFASKAVFHRFQAFEAGGNLLCALTLLLWSPGGATQVPVAGPASSRRHGSGLKHDSRRAGDRRRRRQPSQPRPRICCAHAHSLGHHRRAPRGEWEAQECGKQRRRLRRSCRGPSYPPAWQLLVQTVSACPLLLVRLPPRLLWAEMKVPRSCCGRCGRLLAFAPSLPRQQQPCQSRAPLRPLSWPPGTAPFLTDSHAVPLHHHGGGQGLRAKPKNRRAGTEGADTGAGRQRPGELWSALPPRACIMLTLAEPCRVHLPGGHARRSPHQAAKPAFPAPPALQSTRWCIVSRWQTPVSGAGTGRVARSAGAGAQQR